MDMILDDSFNPHDEVDIWNDQLFNTEKVCAVSKPTDISDSNKEEEYGILGFSDLGDDDIINSIGKQFVWDYDLPNLSYKLESHVSENEDEKIIHDTQNGKMEIENQSKVASNEKYAPANRQFEGNEQILEKLSVDFLKNKEIKKGWKKNTNLPKFLVRIYMKYYQDFSEDQSSSAISYFKRVKKEIKSKGSNAYKISDVLKFFENPKKANVQLSRNNREAMARILRETCQEQIIESNYIQSNLRSYLMRSKVYALRCRSRNLVERVKIN